MAIPVSEQSPQADNQLQQEHNIMRQAEEAEDTEDSTSIESGGRKSRLIVVVPAILSRDPVKDPWTQFSERTNRNLNYLYGNSVRKQLQTNLQFAVHSLRPNTLSKRLMIVLVVLCILTGAATAPFAFWSVSVYFLGVAMVVGGFLLVSRECSKSPVQKLTLAKERIRQLCTKLNDKHSHKVLVIFNGTDLCFFSTSAIPEAKTPANGVQNHSKDPASTKDDAESLPIGLPLHATTSERGADPPSEETPPFVASWSSSKFASYDPQSATKAIFRWKQQDTPAQLESSSSTPVQDEEAQDFPPPKQLLIARGIEEECLEFVSAGMLTPWVLPTAPSHVDETESDLEILETTDAIAIGSLRSSSSESFVNPSNDRPSIMQNWRRALIAEKETP